MARRYRRRLVRLVDRVEAGSVPEAVALIVAGNVTVNGVIVTNPDSMVRPDAAVAVVAGRVLRGTTKLRVALDRFAPDVSDRICLDVGAAAGGFTTALLEQGAAKVYAVDVGYGQLAGRLRQDSRVVNLERTNLAALSPKLIPEPVSVVCLDLSYLAVSDAVGQLETLVVGEGAQLIALVKPTYELHASRMIAEPDAVAKAVETAVAAADNCGWAVEPDTVPVAGAGGAPEVFIYGTRRPPVSR
jgi:23S rRNA (cytidine1920-2'-O)/16S rRNA (cytidine1409-2'-O)-methyltransferase